MEELDLGQTVRGFAAGQKILNRYTFVRILGRGGMGVVWLARDDELEREVALKFLPELVVHDRAVLDELKSETRRSLALTHHNIVRIYDFAQGDDCACIVWLIERPATREEAPSVALQLSPAPNTIPYRSPSMSSPVSEAEPSIPASPRSSPRAEIAQVVETPNEQTTAVIDQIKQFVAEHCRKTDRCDCDGVLSDYASRVDYFDHGVVTKDFIARDCSAYVKAWPEIRLQLTGAVDVRESAAGEYTVSFGYDFDARNRAKGKTSRGHASDTWRVEKSFPGFKITYHRETITNRSAR